MKKIVMTILLALFMFLVAPPICSTNLFVKTRVAPVFDYPDTNSSRIYILSQNEKVNLLSIQAGWCKVTFGAGHGWVKSDFLTSNQRELPINNTKVSSIEVRKRASNFTSSAAASRGLALENVRDRSNVNFKDYDFQTVIWLETNFTFDPNYLLLWWKQELNR